MQLDPQPYQEIPALNRKNTQSNENNDPAWSVGQADNASKGVNTGENSTPASKQGQDFDPANRDSPQNTPPNHNSPGASSKSSAASGSDDEDNTNGAEAPNLNVDPQDPQDTLKISPGATESPSSSNFVVFASLTLLIDGDSTAPNGGAIMGKSTYRAGYEGQISNTPISVGVDKIVIGTTTFGLPTSTPLFIGGQSMVKDVNGDVVLGVSTYPPGGQAQISNHALSAGVKSVVKDGTSCAIPTPGTPDTILVDKNSISRAPDGGAIFEGGTISIRSQSSINDHAISVGASNIVVDGTSYALPGSTGAILQSPHPQPTAPVTLTNGAVLTPMGTAATVSGTTYAIPSDHIVLVVNGQNVPFPTETTLQSVFTVAGQIFTAAPTGFAIGSQSVALDGIAATLDGTVVSLGPSGVQVGSKTMPLTSAQTTEGALGGLIMSGSGGGGEPGGTTGTGNGSSILAFTGESSRVRRRLGIVFFGTVGIVMEVLSLLVYTRCKNGQGYGARQARRW